MKRSTMSVEEAQAEEEKISKSHQGYEVEWLRQQPEDAAWGLYHDLCKVGQFARSGDGELFYLRHVDRRWYQVSSKPGSPFVRFVAMLCSLNSRKSKTREAFDRLHEHLRDRAALMYVELEGDPDGEVVSFEPLRFAKKKRLGSNRRSKRVTR